MPHEYLTFNNYSYGEDVYRIDVVVNIIIIARFSKPCQKFDQIFVMDLFGIQCGSDMGSCACRSAGRALDRGSACNGLL